MIKANNRTEAFQSASASLVASNADLKRGALIIDGAEAEFLGTTLRYPSSDLRVAKFTAYSTFTTLGNTIDGPICTTTSSIYTRPTDALWIPLGTADSAWLTYSTGVCNPCPPGQTSQVVTRLGDLPLRVYDGVDGLKTCTTAKMDDNPITRVVLEGITITHTETIA
jgi:hypothetical protein